MSSDFKDFVEQCTQMEPADRPTAGQLLSHPFFKRACPLSELKGLVQAALDYRSADFDWLQS